MNHWITGWTAGGAGLLSLFVSPATGEPPRSPLPFILAGVGLVLVVAMVLIHVLGKRKRETPPENPQTPVTSDTSESEDKDDPPSA